MVTSDNSNVEGFVLREFSYKESSKIIEIFSKDMGKISIIAKGVLNKKNSNLSSTQRFVKASYNLYKSGEKFFGIRDASLLKSYSKSNKNFDIIIYKSAICDLLLKTIDYDQKDLVYNLLDKTFDSFEKASENYLNIFLCFLLKYISFSGFKPNLSTSKSLIHGMVWSPFFFQSIFCPLLIWLLFTATLTKYSPGAMPPFPFNNEISMRSRIDLSRTFRLNSTANAEGIAMTRQDIKESR